MDDVELVEALYRFGGRLLQGASQLNDMLPQPTRDPRWKYPTPIRTDHQLRLLFLSTMDSLDLALVGLKARTSAVALGALRYQAEAHALICWLTGPTADELERRKRGYRLALSDIGGTQQMNQHVEPATAAALTIADLKMATETLQKLAHEDGIQHLRERPGNPHLFKKYLASGYVLFSALSEIGGHPGFLQLLVFHQDRPSRAITVDVSGQPGERAAWMNGGIDLFVRTCDRIAGSFGFEKWTAQTLEPIAREYAPVMQEAKSRWEAKRGPGEAS